MPTAREIELFAFVEQLIVQFRGGEKEFGKSAGSPESPEDRELIDEMFFDMERYEYFKHTHEDAQLKPEMNVEDATRIAKRMTLLGRLFGRKNFKKINEVLMNDGMTHRGTYRIIWANKCRLTLDQMLLRHLVRDGEGIKRKLNDCTEKNTELQRQLDDASQKISRLETMIRVLGHDPGDASSYTTAVE